MNDKYIDAYLERERVNSPPAIFDREDKMNKDKHHAAAASCEHPLSNEEVYMNEREEYDQDEIENDRERIIHEEEVEKLSKKMKYKRSYTSRNLPALLDDSNLMRTPIGFA
jgi:hypothetical protein